jgi:hypothetical protein
MKIATITGLITIFMFTSAGLYKGYSAVNQIEDNRVEVASVNDKVRKAELSWWQWKNDVRINFLTEKIKTSDDPYFMRKIDDLEKQNRCLEKAKEILGKQPIECME